MPEMPWNAFDDWKALDPSWAQRLGVDLTKIKVDMDPDWSSIADQLASALADVLSYDRVPVGLAVEQAMDRYVEARGHAPW